jgi:serine/threonine-protein kinase
MEVGLTPTEPFPPQDLSEWRRRQALELVVSEDSGTLPSSSQGARSIGSASGRGPRTQRRQFPVVGAGRVVGNKYRIEAPIGSGAVGAVYRASHGDLGRLVAIKVLHPHCRTDPHLLASFRAEARSASLLDHPNVTVVHDFGEDPDGTVYIVMEHLPGATLQSVIDEERRLVPKRAIAIMLQVCAALAAAHERGIVHRDVKPDNIMLVQSRDDEGFPFEVAKVCDFGIAALAGPGLTIQGDGELTAGTPEYMAPEQALGRTDARTDVYACGVVLYEMLTGAAPFQGATPREILARHASEVPRRISEVVVIDARLEALVLRALEKQPDRRFATMRELRAALKKLLG